MTKTIIQDVYNVDGVRTGSIEVRDIEGVQDYIVRDAKDREFGKPFSNFVAALDALDAFRWEVR